jgi:hypothetical protein
LSATPLMRLPVGILVERRKASSPWIDYVWAPSAALAGEPETPPWTLVSDGGADATFFAGAATVDLYAGETSNYRDNLASGEPKLWVVLRPTGNEPPYDLLAVTADPSEGEAFSEPGTDLVETVPMPPPIQDTLAAFVAEHHVERAFFKRQRDRASPDALARRPRGMREDDA